MADLTTFLGYQFVQNALISGTVLGIIAPLIGIFLVTRRYAALADTLAHVSLVGVAGALVLSFNALIGALISSVVVTLGIDRLRQSKLFYPESLLVLFITGSLGLVSLLSAQNQLVGRRLESFLFGSILSTTQFEAGITVGLGIIVLFMIILNFRTFFEVSFNEDLARVQGIRVGLFTAMLAILSAIVVSLGIQIIGGLLVSSLIVVPVLTATNFRFGFRNTTVIAMTVSVLSVWFGMWLAFTFNLPTGGVIVLLNLVLFILSFLLNRVLKLG